MEEKNQPATAHKLSQSKREGRVPKSTVFTFGCLLLGALLLLWGLSPLFFAALKKTFSFSFNVSEFTIKNAFKEALIPFILPLLLFFLGLSIIAIGAHVLQTGVIWVKSPSKRKKERRPFLFLVQCVLVALVLFFIAKDHLRQGQQNLFLPTEKKALSLVDASFIFLFLMAIGWMGLGIVDFFYQKWKFLKMMRMSDVEIKQEQQELEGSTKKHPPRK